MPTFTDLTDFLAEKRAEPLRLPVRGITYEFPGSRDDLPITIGLALVEFDRLMQTVREAIAAGDEYDATLIQQAKQDDLNALLVPRPVREQMIENGVTQREMDAVENTLYLHYLYGAEMARTYWEGKLNDAADGLGETLGLTGESSTRTAPTGSTQASTSKQRQPREKSANGTRGGQSATRGTS